MATPLSNAAYMRQLTGSALVHIIAKPLPEPMLTYCQLEQIFDEIWIKIQHFSFIQENAFVNVVCEIVAILSRVDELVRHGY